MNLNKQPKYYILPSYMQDGMRLYVESGIIPGNFLTLILQNDFAHAAGAADIFNIDILSNYASFLINELPILAWGSEEKVIKWASHCGYSGIEEYYRQKKGEKE